MPSPAESAGSLLSYQGRLTDSSGNLLGGSGTDYFFRFRIYDVPTGGTALFTSDAASGVTLKVTQGVFNVLLGDASITNMSSMSIDFDGPRYLEVDVSATAVTGPFQTFSPRQRIGDSTQAESVVGSLASVSQIFGANLTTCTGSNVLQYSSLTGLFSCASNSAGSIQARETGSAFTNTASFSFKGGQFDLAFSGPEAVIGLDWGSGGPASLSQNETVTGNWTFANGLTLTNASVSGTLEVNGLASSSLLFGSGLSVCSASQKLQWTAGTFSCVTDLNSVFAGLQVRDGATLLSGISSLSFNSSFFDVTASGSQDVAITIAPDSLNFSEFADSMTLDANWAVSSVSGAFTITQWPRWTTHLIPSADNTYDLGSSARRWRDAYVAPGSLHIGVDGDEASLSYDTVVDRLNIALYEAGAPVSYFNLFDSGSASISGGLEIGGNLTPSADGVYSLGLDPLQWLNMFTQNASVTNNLEVTGTASLSAITVNNITVNGQPVATGKSVTSNSIDFDEIADSLTLDASTVLALGGNTLTLGGLQLSGTSASVSGSFEAAGYSSSSAVFGAGLEDCDAALSKLLWNAVDGRFSCGTDLTGGGGGSSNLQIREFGGVFTGFPATASFNGVHFNLTASGSSDVTIGLDWGLGGPASLSQNETVTGNWTFSGLTNFTGGASFSSLAEFTGGASFSALTISGNSTFNHLTFATASGSNLELSGFSSSSALFGAGLSVCTASQKLQWTAGTFSCVTDLNSVFAGLQVREGATLLSGISSLSFDSGKFSITSSGSQDVGINLDWGAGGPASRSLANIWTALNVFSAGVSGSNSEWTGYASASSLCLSNECRSAWVLSGSAALGLWRYNTGTAAPPGSGDIRFNNSTIGSATELYIHETNDNGVDTSNFLGVLLQSGSVLYIQDGDDADNFTIIHIGVSTDSGSYRTYTISTILAQGSAPNNNSEVILLAVGSGGGGLAYFGLDVDAGGTPVKITSLSFAAGMFDFANTASAGLLKLDWGLGGPASLSQNETVTGNWTFSGLSLFTGGASFSAPVEFSGGASFSSLTVSNPSSFTNLTVANLTVTGQTSLTNASASIFEVALLKATTIDSDTNLVQITANATVSGDLEITGFASASSTFGSGLSDCDGGTSKLLWDATTGRFSCGTVTGSAFAGLEVQEGSGTFFHITSLSFEVDDFDISYTASNAFIGLDWTNGPASRSIAESVSGGWEFQNGASFSTLSINGAPLTFTGAGRPTKDITLVPEYPGATLSSISGTCTTCIGFMTSDNEIASPYRNYYKWRTSQTASQSYDIWVKFDLPNDFSSFSSISIEGFRSSTNDRVYFAIFDSANSQSGSTTGKGTSVATSNGAWTSVTVTSPTGTFTAGTPVTLRIRMEAGQNQNVRAGRIKLEYLAGF